jgi:hypothetical protein
MILNFSFLHQRLESSIAALFTGISILQIFIEIEVAKIGAK